jgi:LPS-assembly lipoprotein
MIRLGKKENSAVCGALGRRRLMLAFAGALLVSGCGWRPLYERPGASINSGGASAALAGISIDPVESPDGPDPLASGSSTDTQYNARAAHLLQNYLKEALNPYGPPNPAAYHLTVELTQLTRAASSLGDGTVTREDLVMSAQYKLNNTGGEPVLDEMTRIVTSYDILREPYADLTSRRDAQQRAAQQIAEAIQTRLAAYLVK